MKNFLRPDNPNKTSKNIIIIPGGPHWPWPKPTEPIIIKVIKKIFEIIINSTKK